MRDQTSLEELFNSITHGIGAILSVIAGSTLLYKASVLNDFYKIVGFGIYGICLVILYISSTLFHGIKPSRTKNIFQTMDHNSIYLLIAGSYTPFCLVTLKGTWGWFLLITLWSITFIGLILKLTIGLRSCAIYLIMGWIAIIAIKPLICNLSLNGFLFLLAGGLAYSLGVIFYVQEKKPYFHTIWHFFVMGGSFFHFLTVLYYV